MSPSPSSPWTVELGADTSPGELPMLGGKARGLWQLMQHGERVPPTLVVSARCFEAMRDRCLEKASSLNQLRDLMRAEPLPEGLSDELSAWLRRQPSVRWAVRSSALDEDGATHSFAGQQLTRHDVMGLGELCLAIRQVWVSLYEERALLYREQRAAALIPPGMAVVIQPMLSPRRAGVMFTRDITGDPEERLISSVAGLGTGVVEGDTEGATYYVERGTGYVRRWRGEERAKLTPRELDALLLLAKRVERSPHNDPQRAYDLEWAFVVGGDPDEEPLLYLLQQREVVQGPRRRARPPEVWTNANVGEALPGVGTPLTWSIIRKFSRMGFEQAFGSLGLSVPEEYELVGSFQGRVYLNLTQFMSLASAIPVLRPEVLYELAGGGGVELVKETYARRSPLAFLAKLPVTTARVVSSQLGMPLVAPLWERYFGRERDDFFMKDLGRLTHRELQRLYARVTRLFDRNGVIMLAVSSNFLMSYVVMREVVRWLGGDGAGSAQEQLLVSALEVKSAEPGLELLQLGRLARRSLRVRQTIEQEPADQVLEALQRERDKGDVSQFLKELERFRAQYGHRAPREAELATPRWREDTTFLFEVLKGFVSSPRLPSQREVERDRAQKGEARERFLRERFGPMSRPLFELLLSFVRSSARRREELRALVVDALDMYRELALECGERMVRTGHLACREHVFFLTDGELVQWLDDPWAHSANDYRLTSLVREAVHEAQRALPDPPDTFLLRDGVPVVTSQERPLHQGDTITLFGLPGSSGKAAGRARVLSSPTPGMAIAQGEILVVPYADVGWTPLFLSTQAVVMSLGGPLSHACIVAREYGIPAVVNAKQATELINDGDWLVVDGDQGVVRIERRASQEEDSDDVSRETSL